MGRGKIEIKRIENTSNRQVTYSKRRSGLIKKAKEITVLCDAKVSLIIFASSGKMHEYCSPSISLPELMDLYHKNSGKRLWDAKHESLSNEIDRIKKENDNMQIELRHLMGEDLLSLNNYRDLRAIEEAVENGLIRVRDRKMEIHKTLRRNTKILEEEHRQLSFELQQQDIALANMREMENGFHHLAVKEGDHYNAHMNFGFRVQPIQPNLQERM